MGKEKNTDNLSPEKIRKIRLKEERARLTDFQNKTAEAKLPVLVLVEGWAAAGKGSLIGKAIQQMDPRFYNVASLEVIREEDKRKPFLWRYFTQIPENGKFVFMDSGWFSQYADELLSKEADPQTCVKHLDSILSFERQLVDNGYLLVKVFLNISKEEQSKRQKALLGDEDTGWRVSTSDLEQNRRYKEYQETFNSCIAKTDRTYAPWHIIDGANKKDAELAFLQILNAEIEKALANRPGADSPLLKDHFPKNAVTPLADIPLADCVTTDKTYKSELKRLQKELRHLHNRLYRKGIPVIIAYEGWDAAGKGGNIKRLTESLDPRGYTVHPIASPLPPEKNRHYLWRFYNRLPRTGHIAIFDRTWYGRVMVERLEGFCSEKDWQRAFLEMNEFERDLTDWGAVVIKFWVQIDKDTQLQRFTDRQNTPEKQWKITDEDWRNREKWDLYEVAINEMLEKTSTTFAPWYILESVDKQYARIKALKIVIAELKKALGN
ncbi:MAG: polyphosphate:AMP phosphotransferase [Lachnospiraceae bacterium]|nr:polyphosphate:AMP phosphotransferase [Lachnospiraceae bacterium]